MSSKHVPIRSLDVPGPGSYSATTGKELGTAAPSITFSAKFQHKSPPATPGPGNYENGTLPGSRSSPKISMSLKYSQKLGSFAEAPGPGAYTPDASVHQVATNAPAYTMTGRAKNKDIEESPGPAEYHEKDMLGGPSYTMGSKIRHLPPSSEHAPGPGDYQPHFDSVKPLAPNYTMRAKTSAIFEVKTTNPGPAHYSASQEFTKPKSPAYSMRPQTSPPKQLEVPGPGAYQANNASVATKAPVYSMGGRTLPSFFDSPINRSL